MEFELLCGEKKKRKSPDVLNKLTLCQQLIVVIIIIIIIAVSGQMVA